MIDIKFYLVGSNRDPVDAICGARNVANDIENFRKLGEIREFSKQCHGQQDKPCMIFKPFEDF